VPLLAYMTIYDYIRTMKQAARTRVQVAELKARLSEYLRKAQSGEEVLVLSRDTAVAMLVAPPGRTTELLVRRPDLESPRLSQILLPSPPNPPLDVDIVEILLRERGER
jgi:antitoxin (DNA-binding transcriptional repressor) of toxin-antitoxin stability system